MAAFSHRLRALAPRCSTLEAILSSETCNFFNNARSRADLADVAFLDIRDVCAVTRMSASWIHDEVRTGRFPKPLRFGPRCTRWRSADVRDWLISRAQAATDDAATSANMTARAKRASDAARAKRTMGSKAGEGL